MNNKLFGAEAQGAGNAVTSQNLAITIYTSDVFGNIRTAGTPDNPMFCLADVCNALGLSAKGVNQRLDKEVISNYPLMTAGGVQNALFVNEDGLYDVILDSRKPEAKVFRKWITSEVLPQIRKTGGYIPVSEDDDDLTVMAKALRIMQRTLEEKDNLIEQKNALIGRQAEKIGNQAETIEEQTVTIDEQAEAIATLQPKANAFDEMTSADGTYTATQLAKEFGYANAKAVYDRLIELKILFRQSNSYMPYKKWSALGWFAYRTHIIRHKDGRVETHRYLVFTEKFRGVILYNRHRRSLEECCSL